MYMYKDLCNVMQPNVTWHNVMTVFYEDDLWRYLIKTDKHIYSP